jgi:alpha-L-fucosidase 2
LPASPQGIWNRDSYPIWGSRFTININLQMNYWGAFTNNLMGEPSSALFAQIASTASRGLQVAQDMYGLSGTVAHHNTDLWGDAAPQDNWPSSTFWPSGMAWLATHIHDYYLFSQDTTWLSQNLTPLRNAVLFMSQFLIDYHGYKVTSPSLSPENTFQDPEGGSASITCGPTIDNSILWTLFGALSDLQGAPLNATLSDRALISTAASLRSKPMPLKKNQYGGVQE